MLTSLSTPVQLLVATACGPGGPAKVQMEHQKRKARGFILGTLNRVWLLMPDELRVPKAKREREIYKLLRHKTRCSLKQLTSSRKSKADGKEKKEKKETALY